MTSSNCLRSTSRLLALEPRLLFDGAAAVAVDQAQDTLPDLFTASATDTPEPAQSTTPAAFSLSVARANIMGISALADSDTQTTSEPAATGTFSSATNTSADGTMTVGEDDKNATAVLRDWEIKGSGQITVTVTGQEGGKGSLTHSNQDALTFTGTAAEVTTWLKGVQYQYTQNANEQRQTGDSYDVTMTFTTYKTVDGQVVANQTTTAKQTVKVAPQNDATTVTPPADGSAHFTVLEVTVGSDGKAAPGTVNFGAPVTAGNGFTHAALGLSDPDNSASQVIIKLESIPDAKHGQLVLVRGSQEVVLAVGSTLSVAELGNLEYRTTMAQVSPDDGSAPTPLQSFTFTIDDGAGGRSTGNVVNIALTPVNQAPSVIGSVTIVEGESDISLGQGGSLIAIRPNGNTTTILSERGNLAGSDVDDSTLTYTITSLPAHGTLKYDGVVLTAGNIAATVITDLNKLTYSVEGNHNFKEHGSTVSFGIKVTDSGGGEGADKALTTSGTIELTILANNDDPVLVNNVPQDYAALRDARKVTDSSFTITSDMLAVSDSDSTALNLVFKVTGVNDPAQLGYFTVDGKLLAENTSFTMQDVNAGLVKYHLRTTSAQARIDGFSFQVVDSDTGLIFVDGQTHQRDGGIYENGTPSAALKTHTFTVAVPASEPGDSKPLPDLPPTAEILTIGGSQRLDGILESQGSAVGKGESMSITQVMLNTIDGVSAPDKMVYRLETLPTSGTLTLGGKELQQFDSFTQKDINDGLVKFSHAGGEQFTDEFQFSVSNGSITSDGINTFHITSVPQNDTPTASQGAGLNVLEGAAITINSGGLQHIVLSDADRAADADADADGYANANELSFVVTKVPTHGELQLNGVTVNAGTTITQEQLNSGALKYKHNGSENFKDSFEIQPYDNQGVTTATDTNQLSQGDKTTINITIAPDNDAPVLNGKLELVNGLYEGDTAKILGNDLTKADAGKPYGQLVYTDNDNTDPQQIQYRLTESTQYGQLVLKQASGGEVVLLAGSTFTQADLDAGRIEYRHNGGENHTDTFKYLVSDGDHSVNDVSQNDDRAPGTTLNATKASTFSIHVKHSNDKPSFVHTPSKPVVVDGSNSGVNKAPGFKVGDVDLPDGTAPNGLVDLITVIVRVTDANGDPLTSATADSDYNLKVTTTTGLHAGSVSASASAAGSSAPYLQLTGTRADVNAALASLEVGFATDVNAKFKLQVIVDDRLNEAGTAYQNGGSDAIANGGDKNRLGKDALQDIDSKAYNWGGDSITNSTSFNLNVASVDLWVSIDNQKPEITTTPPAFNVNEDVATKLGTIALSDAESQAFGTWVDVTLSVPAGSGTFSATNLPDGVSVVEGNGTHSLTLRGDVTKLNNFLDTTKTNDETGVFFTSAAHDNSDRNGTDAGDVTLTITLNEGQSNIGTPNADGTSSGDPINGGSAIGGDKVENGTATGSDAPISVSKEVAITIVAANDAPTASNSQSTPLVITDATTPKAIEGFTVSDSNDADFASSGETDFIQVTVRLLDKDGKPLEQADYSGVTLGIKDGASGIAFGGVNDVLALRGTVADVQAALAKLQITLDNGATGSKPGLGNADNPYKVQIIADDRLRNPNGMLIGGANGGALNNTGTGANTGTAAISATDVNVYEDTDFSNYAQNISTAERVIWPSSTNAAPEIERTPTHVEVKEDERTFIGGGFKVSDTESDQFGLPVQITIDLGDKGTLSVGGSGTLTAGSEIPGTGVTVVSGDESGKLVLQGTASAISTLLNDPTKGLFFTSNPNDNADHNGTDTVTGQGDITVALTINEYESATTFGEQPLETHSAFYVTVNPVNDAPVIGGTTNNGNFILYPDRANGGQSNSGWHWTTGADNHDTGANGASHDPIKLLTGATVSDVDLDTALNGTGANSFGGGSITVQMTGGYAPGDLLAVAQMAGIKEGGISGGNGADLVIQLSDAATADQVKAILEAITFDNNGDPTADGTRLSRGYTIVLNDGNNNNGTANAGGPAALNSNALTGTLTFQRYEAPVAVADTGSVSGSQTSTNSNVLNNDSDKVLVGSAPNTGTAGLKVTQIKPVGSSDPAQAITSGASTTVEGIYGTLTIQSNGSYTYTLNTESQAYKELGADLVYETFAYRITDAQGLSADSTLAISVTGVDDPVTVTVNPGNTSHTVHEAHLSDGSAEAKDPSKLGVNSSFTVSAPDGLKDITIGFTKPDGTAGSVTLPQTALDALSESTPNTISTAYGDLNLTGYTLDAATNTATVNYSYTLQHAPNVDDTRAAVTDQFVITGTDKLPNINGSGSGTGTITITIVDDVPAAKPDTNSITEDATSPATGNVLNNDTAGADGWVTTGSGSDAKNSTVVGVEKGTPNDAPSTGIGQGVPGQYGTLTLNADGSYSYVLDNSNLAVQGLHPNDTPLTETYTYTITDKDGDTSTTTLTITITGQDDGVTVTVPDTSVEPVPSQPDGKTSDHVVFESGLSHGSNPNVNDTKVEASFNLSALDGVDSVVVSLKDGAFITLTKAQLEALGSSPQSLTTAFGTMVLNGYTQAADGTITVSYTYTLNTAATNTAANPDSVKETFTVKVTDRDGDTHTNAAEFSITIVDDVPAPQNDSALIDRKADQVTGNVIGGANAGHGDHADFYGADGSGALVDIKPGQVQVYDTDSGSFKTPTLPADQTATVVITETGNVVITDEYGTLTIDKAGNYTFERNEAHKLGLIREYTYTLRDADGDTKSATLTIRVENRSPIITDKGNPLPSTGGNPLTPNGVVKESGIDSGTHTGSAPEQGGNTTTGVITFTPGDGKSTVTLSFDGKSITVEPGADPTSLPPLKTEYGEVKVTSYDPVKGKLEYSYTLTAPANGDATAHKDTFEVLVDGRYTEANGALEDTAKRTASATVSITILDDAPQAVDDSNSLPAGSDNPTTSGNVLNGSGTGAFNTGKDKLGADGSLTVTRVAADGTPEHINADVNGNVGSSITGKYGTLTIQSDGSYIYTLDSTNQQVQELKDTDSDLQDIYTYTITDKDGSTSTATLTITIQGKDDPVEVKVPPTATDTAATPDANTKDLVVFESGLQTGTDTNTLNTTVESSIELKALDGLHDDAAITLTYTDREGNEQTLTPPLTRAEVEGLKDKPKTITTEYGELTFNGYERATDGTITLTYTYTLEVPAPHSNVDGAPNPRDSFTVKVQDRDGDTNEATVNIKIVDDVPVAKDDTSSTLVNMPVMGQLAGNDIHGADGIETWKVDSAPSNGTVTVTPETGAYVYTPNPGFIGTDTFTYTVTDKDGDTSTATVTITVSNTPPIATDDVHTTTPGGTASGNVLTGGSEGDSPDSDADGHTLTVTQITIEGQTYDIPEGDYVLVHLPGKGLLKVDSNGDYEFVPAPLWGGEVPTISYTISDGYATSSATLQIHATPGPSGSTTPYQPIWDTQIEFHGVPSYETGESLTQGDVYPDPSVYWEHLLDARDMRLPELMHPITYVNNEVRASQETHRQYDMQSQWGVWFQHQAQLSSMSTYLGMDPAVFVHMQVQMSQAEGRFWNFLASHLAWNLPTEAPAPATPAADIEVDSASATPAITQASAPDEDAEPADAWLARWATTADPASAPSAPAAEAAAQTSDSFGAQLLAQASTLPSHVVTP